MQDDEDHQPLFMPLDVHAHLLGRALTTVRNRTAAGSWPVPTVKMGGRRMVPVAEHNAYVQRLLAQIEQQSQPLPEVPAPKAPAAQPQQPAKRKPGRPREALARGR